ncbi:transcription factor ETV7 [Thrips palmi]|uniref:Transcription factor ETV7 n=1 Tax=Thrips palmi TaxID=161013 RepID=A0A6P8YJ14_THRPL|nr:transcription factor ETV7 [Thrips palmi]
MQLKMGVQTELRSWEWKTCHAPTYPEPDLPKDPRCWSRSDVATWLHFMAMLHHLPCVPVDRFLMNGKALCLMSMDMFLGRVPLGGKLLYKDFQIRLGRAMYSS